MNAIFLSVFLFAGWRLKFAFFYTDAYLRHYRTSEKAEEEYAHTQKAK